MSETEQVCQVIGGGIVGLAVAIGMRQRGYVVSVCDKAPCVTSTDYPDSRVYAINAASEQLLKQLQVWDKLDSTRIVPYTRMHVWEAGSSAEIDFKAKNYRRTQLGYMIEESVLKQALYLQAEALGVQLQFSSEVAVLESDMQKLYFIAEGALSCSREKLGVKLTTWPYHHNAIVTTLQMQENHQNTAWQVFTEDGPLAFLPMAVPNHVSIVYSTSPQHADCLMQQTEEIFALKIAELSEYKLGSCTVISKRRVFPLIMRQADQYVGKNWLLLGDSAHTIHPLAGLGLNVGLADVAKWLTFMDESRPLLSQVRLKKYQRHRKSAVWSMILGIEALKWSFSNPLPPWVFLRQQGLSFCQKNHFIKQFFIDLAAG